MLLFLIFSGSVVVLYFIQKKDLDKDVLPVINKKKLNKKAGSKVTKSEIKSKFTEKLGEKIVQMMIEVSYSESGALLRDRIRKIKFECEKLNTKKLPEDTKQIISTVLLWANKFNIERHVREMRILKKSSQISYNKKKRDFKLLIPSE